MYRLLAIAKYKDRFVIPTSHREQVADLYSEQRKLWFSIRRWCRLLYDNFLNKGAEKYETKFTNCFFLFFIPSLLSWTRWREALTELLEEIEAIEQDDVKASLATFIKQALNKTNDQLIDSYVYTFDFGKKTNMYLTYMNTGEQRERGIELLELKQHYKNQVLK